MSPQTKEQIIQALQRAAAVELARLLEAQASDETGPNVDALADNLSVYQSALAIAKVLKATPSDPPMLPHDEAERYAADVEAGRKITNQPHQPPL